MAGHFPGDPRFGTSLYPSPDDVKALRHKAFLSTRLLDCLIQRAAPPQDSSSDNIVYLGSLGTMHYMQSSNSLIRHDKTTESDADRKRKQAKVLKIRSTFDRLFDVNNESTKRLIIPIIDSSHFFVLVVDFTHSSKDFFVKLEYYDSMRRTTRRINPSTAAADIVSEVNDFFCNFVLYQPKYKMLHQSTSKLIERVQYHECPAQRNGIDCGLFCIGVVLHLLDGKIVNNDTFNHQQCHRLRMKLSTHFTHVVHYPDDRDAIHQQTSQVVRDCFPQLRGTSIVSAYGVEEVHQSTAFGGSTSATTTITTTHSTSRALSSAQPITKMM